MPILSISEINTAISEAQNLINIIGGLVAIPCTLTAIQLGIIEVNHDQAEEIIAYIQSQLDKAAKFAYGDDDRKFNRSTYHTVNTTREVVNSFAERLNTLTKGLPLTKRLGVRVNNLSKNTAVS